MVIWMRIHNITNNRIRTKLLPEALGTQMVKRGLCRFLGGHGGCLRDEVESNEPSHHIVITVTELFSSQERSASPPGA